MSTSLNLADIRKNYARQELHESLVSPDPLQQFNTWLQEAIQANLPEPTAMVLATADPEGVPSARVVLLKGVTDQGFMFFTNYLSHKGQDMARNPAVALTFFWPELERQIRVEGLVTKASSLESDQYFGSRPLGSQIGAWASPQSKPVTNREQLEAANQEYERKFAGLANIPRPEHWGGYLVQPDLIEFWQGRPNRLHDRIVYSKNDNSADWQIGRLAP
ncbi:pyridoxamine 5'-phosphate oxidase [Adhaeribacter pallidiroseus]|uniref:Pyridoxine/pyridoxamine 5'-phosphate oxidase n=1 Tax=Adhaeribacter pallidiroseus TaxID=2072847 RepID=A0A369QHT6_9BACT|nr:pyridoxamine 5'-phosphate oxidase [Adhaeribacter pallidiroseus]RDC63145.1 Pyridoxal 5'-phosphate synthase [Adhaeribacter pallidiroseus]